MQIESLLLLQSCFSDHKKASNLEAYVEWFNRLSYLVATEICMVSNEYEFPFQTLTLNKLSIITVLKMAKIVKKKKKNAIRGSEFNKINQKKLTFDTQRYSIQRRKRAQSHIGEAGNNECFAYLFMFFILLTAREEEAPSSSH